MGSTKGKLFLMACVAAITVLLAGCTNPGGQQTTSMYPEASYGPGLYTYGVVVAEDGTATCDGALGLTATLTPGGTVRMVDETINFMIDDAGNATVTIKPANAFAYAGVVNGTIPFMIDDADGNRPDTLTFDVGDFGEPIESIILCGGGA